MDAPRFDRRTRALAWLYTGPLGHLYGGVMDWCQAARAIAVARLRQRDGPAGSTRQTSRRRRTWR